MSEAIPVGQSDISLAQGLQITAEAATWKGTPYSLIGPASTKGAGGDCSGITYKVYQVAGLPYPYKTAGAEFIAYVRASNAFRILGNGEKKQDGDILSWPNHMAIYCSFANDQADATQERTNAHGQKWTQVNDMWTAFSPGGPAFGPAELRYWRPDAPQVVRALVRTGA